MTTPNIHLLYAIWGAQYSAFLPFNSVHSVAMPAQLPQKSEESTGYSQDYIILIVNCHCVLEIEPRSSVRAGSTLNYWANSSSPWIFSYYKLVFWILCPILDYYTCVFGVYTATQHVRSDDNLWVSILSFHHLVQKIKFKVTRLRGKHPTHWAI